MHNALKQSANDRNLLREMADDGERSWQRLLSRGAGNQKTTMTRSDPPADFHFPYLVGRPTPYQCCDGSGREHHSGGVLQANQVVWLDQPLHDVSTVRRVTAFTPSAGMIRVDSRSLSVAQRQK